MTPSREPIRQPGWYRITPKGWECVPADDAELEQLTGGGWDLVKVEFECEDVPLW